MLDTFCASVASLKVALNRKGLRPVILVLLLRIISFESSPESEGIKTDDACVSALSCGV